MGMFLIRLGLALGSVVLVEQWPFPALPGLWLLMLWSLPRAIMDRREIRRLRPLAGFLMLRIDTLEAELISALEANGCLQRQVRELRDRVVSASASHDGGSGGHPLFRKVGLDRDCPRWVAEAVRREYRKRLHPDGKPPEQKAEAERRFKQMEEAFSEIWRVRGF
jgi:hypothetical protein